MKSIASISIAALSLFWAVQGEAAPFGYGVARSAAPVLNSPAFHAVFGGRDGGTLKSDHCGQVRELEFIALPGTTFKLLGETRSGTATIYRVETADYPAPANGSLYVEASFIEPSETEPPPRPRKLPAQADIVAALRQAADAPYVWGGNLQQGVPELAGMFYRRAIPSGEKNRLILAGVDCSGLLYQATGGWTPRNTAQLVTFGNGVNIAGKRAADVAEQLKPLDLIVWSGHVVIVLDHETVIESRLACGSPGNGGVVTTPLKTRLAEIMRTRRPADAWPDSGGRPDLFVVRRWYGM